MASKSTLLRRTSAALSAVLLSLGLLVVAPLAPASASNSNDQIRMQGDNDVTPQDCTAQSGWACGGWDQLTGGGVNARPYVKKFSVKTNGVETTIVDNTSNVPNPPNLVNSNLRVVIAPTNLCGPGQPTTRDGRPFCYTTPNRVSVTVAYQADNGGHYDLRTPGATTPAVNSTTEYLIQLGLNTVGQSLRWTYMNGTPTYWKVNQIGQPSATLEIRMRAGNVPFVSGGGGCSQIPVNTTCDATSADEMLLSASMILSLDNTLDAMFTGALFSGIGAYIASLETVGGTTTGANAQLPQLTYGIAAPTTVNGVNNTPSFSAFLSEEVLVNYFGVRLDDYLADDVTASTSTAFFDSAFAYSATTTGAIRGVARWTAGSQGTDGLQLRIANIPLATVATSSLSNAELSPAALSVTNPKYKVKSRTGPTITATRSGVTLTGITGLKVCSGTTKCRVRVHKLATKTSKFTTSLMLPKSYVPSSVASFKGYASPLTAPARVAVIIESQPAGTVGWNYVTSAIRSVS